MAVIPATVFNNPDVRLRVWFDDGTARLPTPHARPAHRRRRLRDDGGQRGDRGRRCHHPRQDRRGAVTGANIASGTITGTQLAAGAAAANLNAGGQSGVAGGGMILSADPSNSNLPNAGYVKLGRLDLGRWMGTGSGRSAS